MTAQQVAPGGLARLLDPSTGVMGPAISQLRRSAGVADAQLVTDGLRAAGGWPGRDTVQVTFGGHFSSGKSSLINMLLGTSLLPAGEDPETGVPCLLRSGTENRVAAYTSAGAVEVSFATEAIARYVSLIGADGDYRQEVRTVRELDITLATAAIPSGVVWADSPGINDIADMTELATRVARDSDILVWVINSKQPFSLTEQAFLRAHMAKCGPASVVFVVNVFLPSDTAEAWQAFLENRAERHLRRITENVDGVPPVIFTSVRAAAQHPGDFGGPAARALIASVSDAVAPAVQASRLFRAEAELRQVTEELTARMNAAEKRLKQAQAIAVSQGQARARQREAFLAAARKAISGVLTRHSETAVGCAAEVAATTNGKLGTAVSYAQQLDRKLGAAAERTAAELVGVIDACARAHQQTPLGWRAAEEITMLLLPGAAKLTASNTSSDKVAGGAGAGAVTGAIVGSAVPVIGTIAGAALGGLIGAVTGAATIGKTRRLIRQQLTGVGVAAAAHTLKAWPWVLAVAERRCTPATPPPGVPDDERLKALRMARATLAQRVLEPLAASLDRSLQTAQRAVA